MPLPPGTSQIIFPIIAAVTGSLCLPAYFILNEMRRRQRRKQQGERAPRESKLLRQPGHSLVEKLEGIQESMMYALFGMGCSGAFFAIAGYTIAAIGWTVFRDGVPLAAFFTTSSILPFAGIALTTLGSLALGATSLMKGREQTEQLHSSRLGLFGEQLVGSVLRAHLKTHNWQAFKQVGVA